MRKSKDITKYDPDWQMVRARVKGSKTDIIAKLKQVNDFWKKNQSIDNWERVVNWLEGLRMGYVSAQDQNALNLIDNEIKHYKKIKPTAKQQPYSDDEQIEKLSHYPFTDRYHLWKDLYRRNKVWLTKGYFHPEHNHFTDLMWEVFKLKNETSRISPNFSYNNIKQLRHKAMGMKNTHKFFF